MQAIHVNKIQLRILISSMLFLVGLGFWFNGIVPLSCNNTESCSPSSEVSVFWYGIEAFRLSPKGAFEVSLLGKVLGIIGAVLFFYTLVNVKKKTTQPINS